ncbi:hypothetical protein [Streptomyces sp. NPDC058045]
MFATTRYIVCLFAPNIAPISAGEDSSSPSSQRTRLFRAAESFG